MFAHPEVEEQTRVCEKAYEEREAPGNHAQRHQDARRQRGEEQAAMVSWVCRDVPQNTSVTQGLKTYDACIARIHEGA